MFFFSHAWRLHLIRLYIQQLQLHSGLSGPELRSITPTQAGPSTLVCYVCPPKDKNHHDIDVLTARTIVGRALGCFMTGQAHHESVWWAGWKSSSSREEKTTVTQLHLGRVYTSTGERTRRNNGKPKPQKKLTFMPKLLTGTSVWPRRMTEGKVHSPS